MPVMSYERWMERTYIGVTSRRSTEMKAVDSALQGYHFTLSMNTTPEERRRALNNVYLKLRLWMQSKGDGWRNSDRNKNHAIENLYDQVHAELFGGGRAILSTPDREALETIRAAQKSAAKRLFEGTRLELKTKQQGFRAGLSKVETGFTAKNVRSMYRGAEAMGMPDFVHDARSGARAGLNATRDGVRSGVHAARDAIAPGHGGGGHAGSVASTVASAPQMLVDIVRSQVNPAVVGEVLSHLHMTGAFTEWVAELVASLIPVKGLVVSGGSAAYNWIMVAREAWRQHELLTHSNYVLPGDARAALVAIATIIDRSYESRMRSAKLATAEFGTRALLQVLDVTGASGAIVGAASGFMSLTMRIHQIGRDFMERHEANKILAKPDSINLRIFETHPILGCYLFLFAETSSLIPFIEEFGQPGWANDVEWVKRTHIDPLRERALGYMNDSRFRLVSKDRNVFVPQFYVKGMKLRTEIKKQKPMTAKEYSARFGRELPSDFRQRIVGIGSDGKTTGG